MKNENPYVIMLNRIDSYLSTLITEQMKIKNEKDANVIFLTACLVMCIAGLLASFAAFNTKIVFFIFQFISFLSTIFVSTMIKKNKIQYKNLEKCIKLLQKYQEIITKQIDIFKIIDKLDIELNYSTQDTLNNEIQHKYNIDKICNLNMNDEYVKINAELEKETTKSQIYYDFLNTNKFKEEEKKNISNDYIQSQNTNFLENQKVIEEFNIPTEPIGFTIDDAKEETSFQKIKRFPK